MAEEDLKSLRELLREAVAVARLSPREMEEALGIGHGRLERLLNGSLDLRVHHVLALAEVLEVSPADFFALGCPRAVEAARHDLAEWLSPPARSKVARTALPRTLQELEALIRAAVRQELAGLRRAPEDS